MFTRTQTPEAKHVNAPEPEPDPAETNETTAAVPLLAVTGDHAAIEGEFRIDDSLRIECEVGGKLEVGGTVVIGENGIVHADVQTVDALILGRYEGDMVATGEVEIAASGRVSGNIRTDSLVINKGGFFNGNVEAIEGEPPAATDADDDGAEAVKRPIMAGISAETGRSGNGSAPQIAADSDNEEESGDAAFLGEAAESVGAGAGA